MVATDVSGAALQVASLNAVRLGLQVVIEGGSWRVPAVFPWVQRLGGIDADEMARVFNMGVGMVLVVAPHFADSIVAQLAATFPSASSTIVGDMLDSGRLPGATQAGWSFCRRLCMPREDTGRPSPGTMGTS